MATPRGNSICGVSIRELKIFFIFLLVIQGIQLHDANWCWMFNILSSFSEVFNASLQPLSYISKSKETVYICYFVGKCHDCYPIACSWIFFRNDQAREKQDGKCALLSYLKNICNSDKYQTALENLQVFVICTVSQVLLGGHLSIYWFASQSFSKRKTILLHSTNGKYKQWEKKKFFWNYWAVLHLPTYSWNLNKSLKGCTWSVYVSGVSVLLSNYKILHPPSKH